MSLSSPECLNSSHFRRIRNVTEDEDEFYSIVNSRDELESQKYEWKVNQRLVSFKTWMEKGPREIDILDESRPKDDKISRGIHIKHSQSLQDLKEIYVPEKDYSKVLQKVESSVQECSSVLDQVEFSKSMVENLNRQLEEMENQTETFQNINQKLESELGRVIQEYNYILDENQSLSTENTGLKEKLMDLYAARLSDDILSKSQLDLFSNNSLNVFNNTQDLWSNKFEEKKQEINQLKKFKIKNERLQKELMNSVETQREINQEFIDFRERINARLEDMTNKMNSYNIKYGESLEEKQDQIQQLTHENDTVEIKIKSLLQELEYSKAKIQTDEQALKEKDSIIKAQKQNISRIKELESNVESLRNEKDSLHSKLQKYDATKKKLKSAENSIAEKAQDLKDLQEKLLILEEDLEEVSRAKLQLEDDFQFSLETCKKQESAITTLEANVMAQASSIKELKSLIEKERGLRKTDQDQCLLLSDRLSSTQIQIQTIESEKKSKQVEIDKISETLKEMENEFQIKLQDSSKKMASKYSKNIEEMKQKYDNQVKRFIEKLNSLSNEMKAKDELLQGKAGKMEIQLSVQEELVEKFKSQEASLLQKAKIIEEQQLKIQKLNKTVKEAESNSKTMTSTIEKTANELISNKEALKSLKSQITKKESSLQDLSQKFDELMAKNKKTELSLQESEKKLHGTTTEYQNCQSNLNLKSKELDKTAKEKENLKKDLSTALKNVEKQSLLIEEFQREINDLKIQLVVMEEKNLQQRIDLENKEHEIMNSTEKIDICEKAVEDTENQLKLISQEKDEISRAYDLLKSECENLTEKLDIYKRAETIGLRENENLEKSKTSYLEQNDHLQKSNLKLKEENSNLLSNISSFQEEIETLIVKEDDLKKTIRKLKADNQRLIHDLESSKDNLKIIKIDCDSQAQQVNHLKQEIVNKDNLLASKVLSYQYLEEKYTLMEAELNAVMPRYSSIKEKLDYVLNYASEIERELEKSQSQGNQIKPDSIVSLNPVSHELNHEDASENPFKESEIKVQDNLVKRKKSNSIIQKLSNFKKSFASAATLNDSSDAEFYSEVKRLSPYFNVDDSKPPKAIIDAILDKMQNWNSRVSQLNLALEERDNFVKEQSKKMAILERLAI